jgi:hypothetical protein
MHDHINCRCVLVEAAKSCSSSPEEREGFREHLEALNREAKGSKSDPMRLGRLFPLSGDTVH